MAHGGNANLGLMGIPTQNTHGETLWRRHGPVIESTFGINLHKYAFSVRSNPLESFPMNSCRDLPSLTKAWRPQHLPSCWTLNCRLQSSSWSAVSCDIAVWYMLRVGLSKKQIAFHDLHCTSNSASIYRSLSL